MQIDILIDIKQHAHEMFNNKPFVGHGKLRWVGNILVLWTNKVLYFQLKGNVMKDLIL